MSDRDKTKEQLIDELVELRQRITELEASETELKRAEEALQQHTRDLELLNRASRAFGSILALDQVLATVLEEVRQMLGVVASSIWLIDLETDELVCQQATGPKSDIVRGWRLAPGEGIAGWVARHGGSLIVPDTQADERYFRDTAQQAGLDLRSMLAVPLRTKQRVIGVLEMMNTEVGRFNPPHLTLLELLAASAAIAIENARLYERARQEIAERLRAEKALRQRTAQLEALREMGLELTAQLDLGALLRSIVSRAAELLGGASGGLYLYRPQQDVLEWTVSVGPHQAPAGIVLHRSEGLAGKVWESGEPLIVDDYQRWEGRAAVWEDYPVAAVMGAPIRWGEEFLGVLDIAADAPRTFSPADAELLSLFATQVAIAIQNAQLYKQAQQEIAERKRAEEALKEYSERLEEMVEERTKELQDAQEHLVRQEKLAVLGQLAGGLGHELRNPLGAIKNAAYFLNMALEEPGPDVKEALGILEKEVGTSDRIISSLLDFARAKPPTRREVGVKDVFQATLSRITIPENVKVVGRLDEALPSILADADQLGQVFGNIILNAIQAMPKGGRLMVRSEALGPEWAAFSFTDTGVGIPQENLGKLFEPLFTTKAKGIGLGLALTRTLVEGHGGTIEVESEVGKGSTFTVKLPTDGEPALPVPSTVEGSLTKGEAEGEEK